MVEIRQPKASGSKDREGGLFSTPTKSEGYAFSEVDDYG
jgi:hypothetical protein